MSVRIHPRLAQCVPERPGSCRVLYVHDFKAAGTPGALAATWARIHEQLRLGDPSPVNFLLGCTYREHSLSVPCVSQMMRVIEYDMQEYLLSSLDLFEELTGD